MEAKADEQFGPLVAKASRKRASELSRAIFGHEDTGHLRYQLLHGMAGTLIEAKSMSASMSVFLVQEFHHNRLSRKRLEQNDSDFRLFVSALQGGRAPEVAIGLFGPFQVPGNTDFIPTHIPAYLGRVVTDLDAK